jgi:hypothetical protein
LFAVVRFGIDAVVILSNFAFGVGEAGSKIVTCVMSLQPVNSQLPYWRS